MNDSNTYWIGGSTDTENMESISFYDYLPTYSGKKSVFLETVKQNTRNLSIFNE